MYLNDRIASEEKFFRIFKRPVGMKNTLSMKAYNVFDK